MIIDISISSISFQLLIIPEADHNGRFYHLQIFIIVNLRGYKREYMERFLSQL